MIQDLEILILLHWNTIIQEVVEHPYQLQLLG